MASRDGVDDGAAGPSGVAPPTTPINGDIARTIAGITRDHDYASQLSSLISEQGLNELEAKKVFETLNPEILTKEISFLKALDEVAKYEGFNPREMIKLLLASHKKYEIMIAQNPLAIETVDGILTINGREETFKFTSGEPFSRDMQFICLMFITRGAAFEKIMKKSSEIMVKCMRILKVKYSINTVTRKPGISLDARTITTPRIAASFPSITVGLFDKGFGRTIFDPETLFPNASSLPRALFAPMISSILPKSQDAPLAVMLLIAVKTDDVLHQVGAKTTLSALYQYLMASFNSTATTEKLKIKYCTLWKICNPIDNTFAYVQDIINLRQGSKDMIQRLRSNDPELSNILSKI